MVVLIGMNTSCKDYLDVVPDNIATIDNAFSNRYEARNYMHGIYSFMPGRSDASTNPAFLGGDELWIHDPISTGFNPRLWYLSRGDQGTDQPIANFWSSNADNQWQLAGGRPLFTGIRDANIFLENINKPFDITKTERDQWIAEVKFLKAYYHFWLLRMYGPVPIIDNNLGISATTEEVQRFREPVDEVVAYIVKPLMRHWQICRFILKMKLLILVVLQKLSLCQ